MVIFDTRCMTLRNFPMTCYAFLLNCCSTHVSLSSLFPLSHVHYCSFLYYLCFVLHFHLPRAISFTSL
ncbi:hypothetical protein BDR07DRAFT_1432921 [Suillus spraguei]|nr:hypothetical protein BDR07DRAFT_1432921 [Suillus spraguei]